MQMVQEEKHPSVATTEIRVNEGREDLSSGFIEGWQSGKASLATLIERSTEDLFCLMGKVEVEIASIMPFASCPTMAHLTTVLTQDVTSNGCVKYTAGRLLV